MSIERYTGINPEIMADDLQPLQRQSLTPDLFMEFIEWVDGSERTTRSYITNLRQFAAWMAYTGAHNPTRTDLISYRDWLMAEHDAIQLDPESPTGWSYRTDPRTGKPQRITCKAGTVSQYLRSVKQFFKWTAAAGLYENVGQNVKGPKLRSDAHKKDALDVADVLTIEDSIRQRADKKKASASVSSKDTAGRIQRSDEQGKRLLAMYLLATQNGLRTIELHRANVKDFQTVKGQAWLSVWGKGHTEADQRIPLAAEVADALRDYLASRSDNPTGNSPLFVSTGNRSKGQRIATTTISTMLKRALQDAGFDSDRLTAHSLRHTAGNAAMTVTEKNIYQTQQYMRHADPKTTEIYLHQDNDSQNAKIAQMVYDATHKMAL